MHYEALKNFKLNTPSGLLEISPGQNVLLQPERALKLVTEGKIKPVGPESNIEDYCSQCSEALERINTDYYPRAYGWISWTKGINPKLWEEIEEAERNLESPIDRRISLNEFATLVDHWETLYRRAIELYLSIESR